MWNLTSKETFFGEDRRCRWNGSCQRRSCEQEKGTVAKAAAEENEGLAMLLAPADYKGQGSCVYYGSGDCRLTVEKRDTEGFHGNPFPHPTSPKAAYTERHWRKLFKIVMWMLECSPPQLWLLEGCSWEGLKFSLRGWPLGIWSCSLLFGRGLGWGKQNNHIIVAQTKKWQ